ncbi:MAG: glucose-1-phosphate thymidylyltransferase RfbA [Rhodospirillales bacterium]
MKGIVLAGGVATRLYPVTLAVSKQLLPVYDKPMIFYPLSTLMLAGIREILVITTPRDAGLFKILLGDGSRLGIAIEYAEQQSPEGIAQAFIIGKDFVGSDACALILGDNIFFGPNLGGQLRGASENKDGATIFCCRVADPARYGVVEFDGGDVPLRVIEKPKQPVSEWAVTGLYFYDCDVAEIAAGLKPSGRGELEITDVNNAYIENGTLKAERLSRGTAWYDAGTHEALLQASQYVHSVETRQGMKVACLEEIAFRMGFIDTGQLERLIDEQTTAANREYLRRVLDEPEGSPGS